MDWYKYYLAWQGGLLLAKYLLVPGMPLIVALTPSIMLLVLVGGVVLTVSFLRSVNA